MKSIYLDYAASTPVSSSVLKAMGVYFNKEYGNPGSLHSFGQKAMKAVDESREKIAKALGVNFREVLFTGSATEANNLALRGTVHAWKKAHPQKNPRVIVSAVEHESVLETARALKKDGCEVEEIPVDRHGSVDLEILEKKLNEDTALVSVMLGNNEIGTVEPIKDIANLVRNSRESQGRNQASINKGQMSFSVYPLLHTDAVQAFQYLDCTPLSLGVDLMTLSGHKIFGPKGVGVLYLKNQSKKIRSLELSGGILLSELTGGGQEFGLRSGTENVPLIVGLAEAIEEAVRDRKKRIKKVLSLKKLFMNLLNKSKAEYALNCREDEQSLPHIINLSFKGKDARDLLIALDLRGIAVSAGAACSMRSGKVSHVLKALNRSDIEEWGALRFSFSSLTKPEEIKKAIKVLKEVLLSM